MAQSLIIALEKSIFIWLGIALLFNKKHQWQSLLFYTLATFIFTLYSALLLSHWFIPVLFVFTFLISNVRRTGWVSEARENFFYLSVVFMLIIAIEVGVSLIGMSVDISESLLLLLFSMSLFFILSLLARRKLFEKSEIKTLLGKIDVEYREFLTLGMSLLLTCYYLVILVPIIFNLENSLSLVFMQFFYVTLLTSIVTGFIHLYHMIMKKERDLFNRNLALSNINTRYVEKQNEVLQQESLIEDLDRKLIHVGDIHEQLRVFNHGQNELLAALCGAIESGNKSVIYEMLEQYGTKVKDVSKREVEFPVISQFKSSQLMPLRFFLLSKADAAIKEGIRFTTEVSEEIQEVRIPVLDLIDILGIWLNNAIEEAVLTEDKWVHTSFILEKDQNGMETLEIRVTNSCRQMADASLDAINRKGVSTKGEGRGRGLAIVEELVSKHEEVYISTRVFDGKFMQLLEIVLNLFDDE
ncbi:MAG: GHKL domain-containing protein [Turicibacter sp.]|nr:GHKL domain-containing protein [Turicibacter sp.]